MIVLEGLRKEYGGFTAVAELSLEVRAGETLVLLGTSGCGKTTTLRMINRLIVPTAGRIRVDGQDIARTDAVQLRRKIGYIIQGVGLFPHWTVEENILTVPRLLGWNRARSRARVEELLALVNLAPELLGRYPHELSGGQRQRVGLARALAADPPIVLMDEPLGALDPITRQQVRHEFRRIESLVNKTTVLVTHDIAEAVELGDRICLMEHGRCVQTGTPAELLFRPATGFVRDFFDAGRLQTEWMAVKLGDLPLPAAWAAGAGLAAEARVAEALALLARTDETAFARVVAAFFDYRRALGATAPESRP